MPGRIVNDVLNLLPKGVPDLKCITVDKVILGLGYSGVKLSTGHVGVCFTFETEILPSCCIHKKAGKLSGSSAIEMMNMARSWDISESVLGIATINALSSIYIKNNPRAYVISEGNILDHITLEKRDIVVFVGRISPLIERIEGKVDKIFILERDLKRRESGVLPDTACEEVLPRANVAIITGATLVNGTIDHLIELSKGAREIAVVGASASILPDPLFLRGVTTVGGIRVLNPDKLLQIVAEGGGTQQLKAAAKFVDIRPPIPHNSTACYSS
jgi:uncharacterized protein (DUF4213/DUF364 family)